MLFTACFSSFKLRDSVHTVMHFAVRLVKKTTVGSVCLSLCHPLIMMKSLFADVICMYTTATVNSNDDVSFFGCLATQRITDSCYLVSGLGFC